MYAPIFEKLYIYENQLKIANDINVILSCEMFLFLLTIVLLVVVRCYVLFKFDNFMC